MYTGKELNTDFETRINKSYSDYYAPATKKAFFRRTLIMALEKQYRENDDQTTNDDLRSVLSTKNEITPKQSQIILQPVKIVSIDILTGTINTDTPSLLEVGDTVELTVNGFDVNISGAYQILTLVNNKSFTVVLPQVTGTFINGELTAGHILSDYFHYLASDVEYTYGVPIKIVGASNQSPLTFIANDISELRTGERVFITSDQTTNNINGVRYIKKVGKKDYALYADADLTNPIAPNIIFQGAGTVKKYTTNTSYPIKSDLIGQRIDEPSFIQPRFIIADGRLKYEPLNPIKVYLDYIKQPIVEIDPQDAINDLTLFMPYRFWVFFINFAAEQFFTETQNLAANQMTAAQIIQNP